MGSKIIQINKTNKSNKIQAEIYRIHNSDDNTVHIRKDVDFNKFRTISVDVNNQQDEEILDQFVKSSPDVIVEDNQILKIQTCQPSIKNSVRRFWDKFTSFFHKPQLDTNNINNIPYPEYDLPSISDIKKKNEFIVDTRLWGIFASRCSYVWDKGYTGRGIIVAVLDTGLTNNPTPAFQNRVLEGVNTCGSGKPTSDTKDVQKHGCVSSDTLVHTSYCGIEPIEVLYNRLNLPEFSKIEDGTTWTIKDLTNMDIKTYSMNTTTGLTEIDNLQYIHKIPMKNKVIKITLEGNHIFNLTPWHIIYTKRRISHNRVQIIAKRADELVKGDQFAFGWGENAGKLVSEYKEISGCDFYRCKNCGYETSYLKKSNTEECICKKCKNYSYEKINKTYKFDENFAYLTGLILTDGYINFIKTRTKTVSITSATLDILEKAQEYINNIGFKSSIRKFDKKYVLYIFSKEFVSLMLNIGILKKDKSYKQDFPEIVGKSPYSVMCAFLAGAIDGDGCIGVKNISNRIVSMSYNFTYKLTCLFNSIGICSSICSQKNYIFSKKRTNKNVINEKKPIIYVCRFSSIGEDIIKYMGSTSKIERTKHYENKHKYQSHVVKNIEEIDYDGYFYDFTTEKNHTYIANGHFISNTNCSGIVGMNYNKLFGVAPECTILPIKVLGDEGVGSLDDIAEGLKYAMELGADICSMSLGGGGYSQIFHNIIKEVTSKGIIIVCASGNETSAVGYPAAYPECIPVGAYNKYNKISYFSNFGPEMSGGLIAPGEDIIGIDTDGIKETIMSGTSQATPHVAGTCALLKQISKKCVTPEIARQALANGAVKILGVNIENQGNGKLDVPNTIFQCSQLISKTKAQSISVKSNLRKFCRGSKGGIISEIQTKLKESGLYTDVVDGIYGRNTMDAVSKFTNGRSDCLDEVEYKKLLNKDFPDAFSRALQLIIDFEGTGYRNIIGNFDGSILTWGIIGFTLSHGEIPEILTEIDDKYPELLRKCFISGYSQLKAVIDKYRENKDLQLFKTWGYNIQEDNIVKSLYKTAFMKLGDEPAVREIQQQRAKNVYGVRAQKLMEKYGLSEDVSFALCFDCSVQGFNEKGQKVAANEISRKKYNEAEKRKIIALANSETCNPRWKKDVWRRRSLFVNRTGEIHGKKYDLGDWGF